MFCCCCWWCCFARACFMLRHDNAFRCSRCDRLHTLSTMYERLSCQKKKETVSMNWKCVQKCVLQCSLSGLATVHVWPLSPARIEVFHFLENYGIYIYTNFCRSLLLTSTLHPLVLTLSVTPRLLPSASAAVLQLKPNWMRCNLSKCLRLLQAPYGHLSLDERGKQWLLCRLEVLEQMPPFLGGGEMIQDVFLDHSTYAEPPSRFEAGTPAIAEAIGLGAAVDYLSDIGMEKVHAYEQELGGYLYQQVLPALQQYHAVLKKAGLFSSCFCQSLGLLQPGGITTHACIGSGGRKAILLNHWCVVGMWLFNFVL